MSFFWLPFWFFLLLFILPYRLLSAKGQNAMLLGANLLFLACWSWEALFIHLALAFACFLTAKQIAQLRSRTVRRRALMWVCVAFQCAVLVYFKIHAGKILGTLPEGVQKEVVLALPIGLSFYSLQMMGYVLEVYWRRIEPSRRFLDFLLFTSFFPLIPMGPIERYQHLSPQFEKKRRIDTRRIERGAFLIALGVFKKMAIADALYLLITRNGSVADSIHGLGLWAYCFLAFMQLYADFSGFIDIARGIAQLLGLDLLENFDQPYLARNVSDVWYRWHITLVRWLRDFVYFPLMLETRSVYLSGATVILLVAVWHEVSFRYLLWGGYWILLFGGYVTWKRFVRFPSAGLKARPGLKLRLAQLVTLTFVSLSSLCFMVRSFSAIPRLLMRLFWLTPGSFSSLFDGHTISPRDLGYAVFSIGVMIGIETLDARRRATSKEPVVPGWAGMSVVALLLVFLTAAFGASSSWSFIYLRY